MLRGCCFPDLLSTYLLPKRELVRQHRTWELYGCVQHGMVCIILKVDVYNGPQVGIVVESGDLTILSILVLLATVTNLVFYCPPRVFLIMNPLMNCQITLPFVCLTTYHSCNGCDSTCLSKKLVQSSCRQMPLCLKPLPDC